MSQSVMNLIQALALACAASVAPVALAPLAQASGPAPSSVQETAPAGAEAPAEGQTAPAPAASTAAPVVDPDKVAPHVPDYADEIENGTFWMPVAASDLAREVDATFNFIMWINYVFTALILALLVIFVVKYRRRPGVVADQSITHNTPLEIAWSVLPTILLAVIFWQGYVTFLDLRMSPKDALPIRVKAYTWGWNFTYPDGTMVPQQLAVPVGRPVEFIMSSQDTLHSLHLPAFRQKVDVLPDRYTKLWFDTSKPGTYRIYCTEYCGKDHSNMYALLQILPQDEFDAWMEIYGNPENGPDGKPLPIVDFGRKLWGEYYGCKSCHNIDGQSGGIGPTFKGLWGSTRRFTDGTTAVADENYVADSLRNPHGKLVEGYGKLMPLFHAMPEKHVIAITEFLKTLPK